jgi:hypothetical protein
MTWNDIATPRFLNLLFGALSMTRPAAQRMEARRGRWAELDDLEVSDFEDTRPCRWLLTEPPPLDSVESQEHVHTPR